MNKKFIIILILLVSSFFISIDDTGCADLEAYNNIVIASDDSGRAMPCPCRKPRVPEDECEKRNTCRAWRKYYICFEKFILYCD